MWTLTFLNYFTLNLWERLLLFPRALNEHVPGPLVGYPCLSCERPQAAQPMDRFSPPLQSRYRPKAVIKRPSISYVSFDIREKNSSGQIPIEDHLQSASLTAPQKTSLRSTDDGLRTRKV